MFNVVYLAHMQDQIVQVKDATDLVTVVGERLALSKAGSNFKGLCPFHSEKSPSFFVNPQMQRYMCFGCHETGDCFSFLQKYDSMTFSESLHYLAQRAGIKLESYVASPEDGKRERILAALSLAKEYYHFLLTKHASGKLARDYLEKRGTTAETIELFGLGVSLPSWDGLQKYLIGKKKFSREELLDAGLIIRSDRGTYYDRFRNRLMFPLTNARGNVVGFSGRILEDIGTNAGKVDQVTAKYINSPETITYHKSDLLFGYSQLHRFIREKEEIVLVEGEFDVLSSFQAHVKNVSAIKGSALTKEQLKLIARSVKRVIFALDNDKAGVEATKRAIGLSQEYGVLLRVIQLAGGKDPDDIARQNPEAWRKLAKSSVSVYDYLIEHSFSQHDPTSGDGKREITNELGKIISGITNAVEQAYYIQKIALRLGAKEEVVFSQFARSRLTSETIRPAKPAAVDTKDRESTLEEYLCALVFHLQGDEFVKHFDSLGDLIQSPLLQRICGHLTHPHAFELSTFTTLLPAELKDVFLALFMRDDETIVKSDIAHEFADAKKQLLEMRSKKTRERIALRITQLEEKDQLTQIETQELENLQAQITLKY